MMETTSSPSKPFLGVRFVLAGFDPLVERKVRSKIVNGGGVDVGQYNQNCTHLIVDKIVYDDAICVAARNDGKTVVTVLWVDHSFDIGMVVDPNSVMYRPPKDLNGIPGAKNLTICLTGYQRQDREDIMTMVSLIGAQFSKPLVASKVTHLICYKFEGEKYELAKKMMRIKLVNHCWLEDSLRDWVLLPEANYDKSGYELETLEAEARDSEEEAEDTSSKQPMGRIVNRSPLGIKAGITDASVLPQKELPVPGMQSNSSLAKDPLDSVLAEEMLTTGRVGTPHKASGGNSNSVSAVHGYKETSAFENSLVDLLDQDDRNPDSIMVRKDLASLSKGTERSSLSGTEHGSSSHMRKTPRNSPLSKFAGKLSNNLSGSPKQSASAFTVTNAVASASSKMKLSGENVSFVNFENLPEKDKSHKEEKEATDILPQKRVTDVLGASSNSKQQKTVHNSEAYITKSPVVSYKRQLSKQGLHERYESALGNDETSKSNFCATNSPTKYPSLKNGFTTDGMCIPKSVNSERSEHRILDEKTPHISPVPDISGLVSEEANELQNQKNYVGLSSFSNMNSLTDKSKSVADMDSLKGDTCKPFKNPAKKKTVGSKTLSSRTKLSNTANQKGSIYSNKVAPSDDSVSFLSAGKQTVELLTAKELDKSAPTVNVEGVTEIATEPVSRDYRSDKVNSVDEETEAPDGANFELAETLNEDNPNVVVSVPKAITNTGSESGAQQSTSDSENKTCNDKTGQENETSEIEQIKKGQGMFVSGETTLIKDTLEEQVNKRKTRTTAKAKVETVPALKVKRKILGGMKSNKKELEKEEAKAEMVHALKENTEILDAMKNKNKNVEKQKEDAKFETVPAFKENTEILDGMKSKRKKGEKEEGKDSRHPADKIKSSEVDRSMRKEKKNTPVLDKNKNKNISPGKLLVKNTVVESGRTLKKLNNKSRNIRCEPITEAEPTVFILSGHRLQRKEFQKVIRHLKGRLCRDSHQWSYQATHFIAPDLRRTEKLFAAAASGRWILKCDYLSACNEAGCFLPEEPFEWYKSGLSEDGTINLEGPRKWRQVREKTGHGAFNDLRIIVYGDCFAPPLDTLKRVVKAGDGTVVATSPPYTRALESGVDFAVVSPGMPHVDMWIQEFLKYKIPCVLADYLVEYVCKPGFSLDKHVLYNTHAWAESSLSNLRSKTENVAGDSTDPVSSGKDDVSCDVCGSGEREDVMLICGDESGGVGCGIGTHIDCCDPPLEEVPEGDWLCKKCSSKSKTKSNGKKRRKAI